jgi:multiple sugar transport system substrate-binding protein
MGAEGKAIGELVPLFEDRHPDIHIHVETIPWSAAHEKLLTAYAGNATPDICQLGNTWIPEFQAIDALIPLDSLILSSETVADSAYFSGIWDTNIINGETFGVPWYADTRVLFYRTDILENAGFSTPPENWKQWMTICNQLKICNGKDQYSVFFSTIFNDWQVPVIMIFSNGGILLNEENTHAAFNDPLTVEALHYYVSFFKKDYAIKSMSEVSNIYQGFADGAFSMMVTGPWNVNELIKRVPEINGRWGTAVMPKSLSSMSVAGGASLVLFRNCRNKGAAWKFIEFLSEDRIQQMFFELTGALPAIRRAWQHDRLRKNSLMTAFYQQLEQVRPTPKIAEWEQIAVKLQEYLERVIHEKMTLHDAVNALNRDVDAILEKRRWLLERELIP